MVHLSLSPCLSQIRLGYGPPFPGPAAAINIQELVINNDPRTTIIITDDTQSITKTSTLKFRPVCDPQISCEQKEKKDNRDQKASCDNRGARNAQSGHNLEIDAIPFVGYHPPQAHE